MPLDANKLLQKKLDEIEAKLKNLTYIQKLVLVWCECDQTLIRKKDSKKKADKRACLNATSVKSLITEDLLELTVEDLEVFKKMQTVTRFEYEDLVTLQKSFKAKKEVTKSEQYRFAQESLEVIKKEQKTGIKKMYYALMPNFIIEGVKGNSVRLKAGRSFSVNYSDGTVEAFKAGEVVNTHLNWMADISAIIFVDEEGKLLKKKERTGEYKENKLESKAGIKKKKFEKTLEALKRSLNEKYNDELVGDVVLEVQNHFKKLIV